MDFKEEILFSWDIMFFFSFYKHLTLSIGVRENKNGQKKGVIFVLEKKGF